MGYFMAALPAIISMVLGGAVVWAARRVAGAVGEMVAELRKFQSEHRLLMETERNDLKSHIVAIYERAKERGYITPMELETANRLFDSYRKLGGNSYIEVIMHDMNNNMEIVGMPIPAAVAAMDAAAKER
jgi:hypothetical protein